MAFGASDPSAQLKEQQQQDQASVNKGLGDINQQFAGFTPDFYSGIQKAYTASAAPSLQQQYAQTKNQLGFKLAGQGLDDGSSQQKSLNDNLASTQVQAQQQVANNAIGQSQALQQDVSNEKTTLINQLEASKDPAATALQAREAALNLGQVPAFNASSVSNLFGNFAGTYLNQQNLAANNAYNQNYYNGYNSTAAGSLYPSTMFGALPPNSISTH